MSVGAVPDRAITNMRPQLHIVVTERYCVDEQHAIGIYEDHDLFVAASDRVKRAEGAVLVCLLPGEDVTEVHIDPVAGRDAWEALIEAREAIDVAIKMSERLNEAFILT